MTIRDRIIRRWGTDPLRLWSFLPPGATAGPETYRPRPAPGARGGSVSHLDLAYAKSITGPGGNLAGPGDRGPDPAPITPLRMPEPGKAVVLIVGSHPATAVDVTDDVRALMAGDSWDAVEAAERRLRGLLG